LIGFGGPIAANSFGAAKYVLAPLRLSDESAALAQPALATVAILFFAAVHISGGGRTIGVQGGTTALKLGILVALAAAGLAAGWGRWENLDDRPALTPNLLVTMTSSLVYISYAYTGWNAASYLAGEIERPRQRLPQAILLGTGLVLALYLALNVAYALALPAAQVKRLVDGPVGGPKLDAVVPIAQLAAERLYGPRVSAPLSVAIGLTLLASVSAYVLTGPRVAFAMARAGQFPAIAGRISPRWGTPAFAICMQVAWALVLLWTASFERILVFSAVGLAMFSMLTVGAVYMLRWRQPELPRPFSTPGYPVVPAVFLVASGLLVVAVFKERPIVSSCSLLVILAGVPIYFVWASRNGGPGGKIAPIEGAGQI
jgi:APA family basic amino acid/polyamine antiporter